MRGLSYPVHVRNAALYMGEMMMIENANVTLPLSDFDELREESKEFRKIARCISACFEYVCKENPEPEECKNCHSGVECEECEIYKKYPAYDEYLTLDVARLVRFAKKYALYGKEAEADLDNIPVHAKTENGRGIENAV